MQFYHILNRTLHWRVIEWLLNTTFGILKYLKGNHYLSVGTSLFHLTAMHSRWVLTWSADTLDVKLHICMIKLIIKELKKAVLVDNCCTTPTPDPFCGHTELELGSSFPYELLVQPHAAPTEVWKFVSCLFGDELTYGWDLSGY